MIEPQDFAPSPWRFWEESLAGRPPETTPGTPHQGFYIARRYVSIPGGAKRVLTDFPVAIWRDDETWRAVVWELKQNFSIERADEVDELFASVCRNPISHAKYQEMGKALQDWRASNV